MEKETNIVGPRGRFFERLRGLAEREWFHNFILGTIIFNAIILGLMTSTACMNAIGGILDWASTLCLVIFTIEIIIRITAYGWRFFLGGWNWFDFLIVASTLVPASSTSLGALRVVRVLRVFRTLRLMSSVRQLRIIVKAILVSMPSVMWTGALLMIFFYIYALIGQNIFGKEFYEWFGTIGNAMYTLFQVMTLESWSMGISRPVMEAFPYAWVYFVSFVMISSYTIINVIVGIVVNAISEISDHEKVTVTDTGITTEPDNSFMEGNTSNAEIKRRLAALKTSVAELETLLDNCEKK